MARLSALFVLATVYRVGCDCTGGAMLATDAGATVDAGPLTLLLDDPATGSTTQTARLLVDVAITGDESARAWCLDVSPATAAECDAGWQTSRPATYLLGAGDGSKTVWLTIDDGGTASASITVSGTPPPITFHRRPVHISSARQAATLLSGWCGAPGGAVVLSGGGTAMSVCGDDAGWSATVDFSSAPQGNVTVTGVQWSASVGLPSAPATHTLIKDTAFCDDTGNAAASPFAGGSGMPGDPYVVCTPAQLAALNGFCGSDALLRNDIVLDGNQPWPGLCVSDYTGTFEGSDYAVANVTSDAGLTPYGLFLAMGGTVQNLSVENVYIEGTFLAGALAGVSYGTVRNCSSTGRIVSGPAFAYHLGGLIGDQFGECSDSESSVDLSCENGYAVGGLIGHAYGTVERCHASGSVYAGDNAPGGLIGRMGDDAGSYPMISDSYATGPVASGTTIYAGGLVGEIITGAVTRCYATGAVSGAGPSGGLVAAITFSGGVTDSYWDVETTGVSTSAGGTAYTSAQMSDAGSYPGWDFTTVWTFDATQSAFPVLRPAP